MAKATATKLAEQARPPRLQADAPRNPMQQFAEKVRAGGEARDDRRSAGRPVGPIIENPLLTDEPLW